MTDSNPFLPVPQSDNALARTDQQRAITEVQAALVVARSAPRDQRLAWDRIMTACQRPGLAEAALYSYARGGTDISGPSIRLAEAIAQAWGNLQFGLRELEQSVGNSTVQAYAWDVETNIRREVTFQVKHERHTKAGKTRLTDPRDIYETIANQGARRLRSCILAVIPGDLVDAAVTQCDQTMRTKADVTPEGVARMVEAFAAHGVTRSQIELRIQRRIEAIQPAQMVALRKVYLSLQDGMSKPEDWFTLEQSAQPQGGDANDEAAVEQADSLAEPKQQKAEPKQEKRATAKAPKKAEQPKPEPEPEPEPKPLTEPDPQPEPEPVEETPSDAPRKGLLPLEPTTPVLLPWEVDMMPPSIGTTRLRDSVYGIFEQWRGKADGWFTPQGDDQEAVRTHVKDQLRRLLHASFRDRKLERAAALEWVRSSLSLQEAPQTILALSLQALVELVRKLEQK